MANFGHLQAPVLKVIESFLFQFLFLMEKSILYAKITVS